MGHTDEPPCRLSAYPLTGVGTGTFHFLAPDYWRRQSDRRLVTDNAQNWWRHQAAELGLFGSVLIVAWSALIAWLVLARPWRPGITSATVRGMLIGMGTVSLLGVPTQVPIVLVWFFFLIGWMTVLVPGVMPAAPARSRPVEGATAHRLVWIAAVALALAYAAGHVLLAQHSLAVAERARRADRDYYVGAHSAEPFEGGSEFRWTTGRSRLVVHAKTRWLVLRLWAHHPDIAAAPVHVTLSNRCGTLWEETLHSFAPVTIGVILPEDERSFDASVAVSRTWQPSAFGQTDNRQLGVGIVTDFVSSGDLARSQMHAVQERPCRN